MADSFEKQIDSMLQNGESKQSVFTKFNNKDTRSRLIFFLNNKSTLARRRKYMWINLFLGIVLLGMTIKLLLAVADTISEGGVGFYLLALFIVPTINFYILREIFQFHRTGYQFLTVLTGLSLIIYPVNRILPDLVINTGMIALAVFLYLNLFPKRELLKFPKK